MTAKNPKWRRENLNIDNFVNICNRKVFMVSNSRFERTKNVFMYF